MLNYSFKANTARPFCKPHIAWLTVNGKNLEGVLYALFIHCCDCCCCPDCCTVTSAVLAWDGHKQHYSSLPNSQPSKIKCYARDRVSALSRENRRERRLLLSYSELCSFPHLCVPAERGRLPSSGSGLTSEFPGVIKRLLSESQLIDSGREKTVILREWYGQLEEWTFQ